MKSTLQPVILLLMVMWLVMIVDWAIPVEFIQWGIRPRSVRGLIGIPLSPFLHGGFGHLIGNTVPLIVLLVLTLRSRDRGWIVVGAITMGGGALLWLVGRNAIHVGASGVVFGLIAYLITAGIRERAFRSMGVAILVGLLFGGTLLSGVLPTVGAGVSWDGHLCGAIAGTAVAMQSIRKG